MKPVDKTLQELDNSDDRVRILSLMQIHSAPVVELESSANLSKLLKHLGSLSEDKSLDVSFLSRKLLNKFQVLLGKDFSIPPTLGSEEVSYESLRDEKDPLVLAGLLRQIPPTTELEDREILLGLLAHSDSRVRSNAVEAMDRDYHDSYHDPLFRRLSDRSNRVCANAAITLGKRDLDKVVPHLSSLLTHESLAMRESALYCLEILPWHKDFCHYIKDALLDPYIPVALRAVSLCQKYEPENYQKILEDLYFSTHSALLKSEIRLLWKTTGIPISVQESIKGQMLNSEFRDLGVKIFQELKAVEPFTPQLRSRYFLIIRQQDVLKVILDQGDHSSSPNFTLTVRGLQDKVRSSFIALGRTAFHLHQNREYFFEQCEEALPKIDQLLEEKSVAQS